MIWETLAVCRTALATHKLRTVLSALGVFFGVGAVIGMLSIGEGAKREALNLIRLMGEKHLIVKVKEPEKSPDRESKDVPRLTEADLNALEAVLPGVRRASPLKALRNLEVTAERTRARADIHAVESDYAVLLNLKILRGRFFSEADGRRAEPVCVIGNRLAVELFGGKDPLGGLVKIRRNWYHVVGITGKGFEVKGELKGLQVEEAERAVYVPLAAYLLREGLGRGESPLDEIALSFADLDHLPAKKVLAERVLKRLHFRQVGDQPRRDPGLTPKRGRQFDHPAGLVIGDLFKSHARVTTIRELSKTTTCVPVAGMSAVAPGAGASPSVRAVTLVTPATRKPAEKRAAKRRSSPINSS